MSRRDRHEAKILDLSAAARDKKRESLLAEIGVCLVAQANLREEPAKDEPDSFDYRLSIGGRDMVVRIPGKIRNEKPPEILGMVIAERFYRFLVEADEKAYQRGLAEGRASAAGKPE